MNMLQTTIAAENITDKEIRRLFEWMKVNYPNEVKESMEALNMSQYLVLQVSDLGDDDDDEEEEEEESVSIQESGQRVTEQRPYELVVNDETRESGKDEEELISPTSNRSTPPSSPFSSEIYGEKGCYLVYDPSSNGRLMIYYSKTVVNDAIGFWKPGDQYSIQEFKFKQNLGRSELIGNCAAGITGRKNYYSGWCQFIRAAKALHGTVTIFHRPKELQGLDVDVFVYYKPDHEVEGQQTVRIEEDIPFYLNNVAAVTCLPKCTTLFDEYAKIELSHWMTVSSKVGASTAFAEAESTTDAALMVHLIKGKNYEPSKYDLVRDLKPNVPSKTFTPPISSSKKTSSSPNLNLMDITKQKEGCYLLYNSDGAKLTLIYSKEPVPDALGFWQPGPGKKIAGFKFKKNLGRSDLQANCASGVTGRKNYYSGICQFIRAAKVLDGCVFLYNRGDKPGLDIDVYAYYDNPDLRGGIQTFKVEDNTPFYTGGINAVTCLPKHADFFEDNVSIDLNHWMTKANAVGAASRFEYHT